MDDTCDALLQAVKQKAKPHQDNTTVIVARAYNADMDEQDNDDIPTRPIRVRL